jgi:hypothetical protein
MIGYNTPTGGGILKKIVLLFILIQLVSIPFAQARLLDKYPGNADKKFQSANDFYKKVNQSEYSELPNASFNTKEKVLFKDANMALSRIPEKFGAASIGGTGYSPERQVYVFASAGFINNKRYFRWAVFDAELGRKIAAGESRES